MASLGYFLIGLVAKLVRAGHFGGIWAIVVVSVVTSIVGYAVAAIVKSAVLAAWVRTLPNA